MDDGRLTVMGMGDVDGVTEGGREVGWKWYRGEQWPVCGHGKGDVDGVEVVEGWTEVADWR